MSAGCFKDGERVSGARFCHECRCAGGTEVVWTFKVLDADRSGAVVGHVHAALSCNSHQGRLDEGGQRAALLAIVEAQLALPQ